MLVIKNNQYDLVQRILNKVKENDNLIDLLEIQKIGISDFLSLFHQYYLSLPSLEKIKLLDVLISTKNIEIPLHKLIESFIIQEKLETVLEFIENKNISYFLQSNFDSIEKMDLDMNKKIKIYGKLNRHIDVNVLKNTLHQQLSLDFLKVIPDNSVDVIIADPPYIQSNNKTEFIPFTQEWLKESFRVLKSTGTLHLYSKHTYLDGYKSNAEKHGFHYVDKLVYEDVKSKKVLSSANYQIYVIRFTKDKNTKSEIDFSTDMITEKQSYTMGKSPNISRDLIASSSHKGDIVLIPFGGTGGELVACTHMQRNWIYTEENKGLLNIAKSRLKEINIL